MKVGSTPGPLFPPGGCEYAASNVLQVFVPAIWVIVKSVDGAHGVSCVGLPPVNDLFLPFATFRAQSTREVRTTHSKVCHMNQNASVVEDEGWEQEWWWCNINHILHGLIVLRKASATL